jgi:tRNA-dihydrouridine synthase A
LLGLFNGLPGSRQFRRHLSEQAYKKTATLQVIEDALAFMPDQAQSPETPLQQLSN